MRRLESISKIGANQSQNVFRTTKSFLSPKYKKLRKDKNFVIASYYTLDLDYITCMARLKKSLDLFDLDYYVEEAPYNGNWQKSTRHKAVVIKNALETVNKPVIWVDADAEIIKYPKLFDHLATTNTKVEVAAFINHINNLLGGTVYFANNDRVKKMVDNWKKTNKRNKTLFEQSILQSCIAKNNIIFENLPVGYCQIKDYITQAAVNEKYIIHHQISRITKKRMKGLYFDYI